MGWREDGGADADADAGLRRLRARLGLVCDTELIRHRETKRDRCELHLRIGTSTVHQCASSTCWTRNPLHALHVSKQHDNLTQALAVAPHEHAGTQSIDHSAAEYAHPCTTLSRHQSGCPCQTAMFDELVRQPGLNVMAPCMRPVVDLKSCDQVQHQHIVCMHRTQVSALSISIDTPPSPVSRLLPSPVPSRVV